MVILQNGKWCADVTSRTFPGRANSLEPSERAQQQENRNLSLARRDGSSASCSNPVQGRKNSATTVTKTEQPAKSTTLEGRGSAKILCDISHSHPPTLTYTLKKRTFCLKRGKREVLCRALQVAAEPIDYQVGKKEISERPRRCFYKKMSKPESKHRRALAYLQIWLCVSHLQHQQYTTYEEIGL